MSEETARRRSNHTVESRCRAKRKRREGKKEGGKEKFKVEHLSVDSTDCRKGRGIVLELEGRRRGVL